MVVRAVAEKDHAMFIPVGNLKAHDLGPKLRGPLNVTDSENHVTQLLDPYRSGLSGQFHGPQLRHFHCCFFLRHISLLALGPTLVKQHKFQTDSGPCPDRCQGERQSSRGNWKTAPIFPTLRNKNSPAYSMRNGKGGSVLI